MSLRRSAPAHPAGSVHMVPPLVDSSAPSTSSSTSSSSLNSTSSIVLNSAAASTASRVSASTNATASTSLTAVTPSSSLVYAGDRTRVLLADGVAVKTLQFRTAAACAVTREVVLLLLTLRHGNVEHVMRLIEDAESGTSAVLSGVPAAAVASAAAAAAAQLGKPGTTLTLICEYCPGGSLEELLHSNLPVTPIMQRAWAHGIAAGMQSLHRANVLHLDLATRNVLLGSDLVTPKICDFKMSIRTAVHDPPVEFRDQASPLKWMSPESLQTRRVTRKHDVWAYGVTLLEILYRAEPYAGKDAMEVATGVSQMRLRPTFSPAVMATMPDMVAMAKWCVAWGPSQRPSFDAVLQSIALDANEPAPAPALKRPPSLALPIVPTPSLSLKVPSSSGNSSAGVISRSPSAGSVLSTTSAPSSASSTPRRSGLYQCGACSQRFNSAMALEDHLQACVAAARTSSDDGGGRSPRKMELPPSSPSLDVLARWRIDWNDLNRPPPVLIGEGFHALVLGANWRGARVALKLHKRVAGGQQSGAIRVGGQAEFDTEQIEAERVNRVAAAAEDAKDISSLLDVHADEIIAEAQLMANLSPHPNCVQLLGICAAIDHQMLTNRGFLFLDQVLALVERDDAGHVTDWRGLRVANYDPATMQLVYDEPCALIVTQSDVLVEFTSSAAASARDPLVSVLTTPEHELFVLPVASSKRSMTRDETQPTRYAKLAADKALAHDALHFLARAENGVDVSGAGATLLDDAQLELFGRWLSGGALRAADGALLLREGLLSRTISDSSIVQLCDGGLRLGDWCWSLPASGARAILRGLREGEHIYTDDAEFRDQVVRLALHAGFTAAFDCAPRSPVWRIVLAEASNVDRPLLRRSVDQMARVKNPHADQRVWCFRMPRRSGGRMLESASGGGFVVMRRAALGDDGATVVQASRPTVQGNCFSPFLIVTEFMPGGSLRALLDMGGIRIDERMRIDILADVAAGMRHLNLEGILHKDLAARNVLLAGAPPTLRAKVCDFGLSRVLSDAEHASTTEPGPTKWLPRESLLEWKFSSASDVWMFAITAIEVLTRQLPYPDMPHQQYIALLVSRQLDPFERAPADTNPLLARCLRQCLSQVPAERPSFESICATLDQCRHPQTSPAPVRRPALNTYN